MRKKIFIIFIMIMLTFGTNVQALTECANFNIIGTRITELDGAIEMSTEENVWEDISITRYLAGGIYMYEIGPKTKSLNRINSGRTEKDLNTRDDFIKIIKNGNKEENIEKYGLDNKEDMYIATKIALDCYIHNYSAEKVSKHYNVKTDIKDTLKERAKKIMNAVPQILEEKTEEINRAPRKIKVTNIKDFNKDDVNPNYYSLEYKVTKEGDNFLGYDVSIVAKNLENYLVTTQNGEENKTEFKPDENVFKIMIPNEYKDLEFEMEVHVTGKYKDEKIFRAVGYLDNLETPEEASSEYIIYEDGVYEENAESIIFTHKKIEDTENGEDKVDKPEKPDDGKQDEEETNKKPNSTDKEQEKDKNKEEIKEEEPNKEDKKEDTEVKETVNDNITKPNVPKEEKKLPRTRK